MADKQCSELFFDVFDSHCGGCYRECACGLIHFDTYNHWDWEEGELDALIKKAEEEPEKYSAHDCSIGTMSIGGEEIVYNCTCKLAEKYESFIITHANDLAEYLNKRSEMLKEASDACKVNV